MKEAQSLSGIKQLAEVPVGNYYDKFNTANPVAKYLMTGFKDSFRRLFSRVQGKVQSVLEVGCGEGYMLELMRAQQAIKMSGLDIDIPILLDAKRRVPAATIALADGHDLPYPDHTFDLVVACEVLEHVSSPERVLQEMRRVGCNYFIFSVPREPGWRVLNIVRGRYIKDLGNTPGHINHWSSSSFVRLVAQYFYVIEIRQPLPWTMVLCGLDRQKDLLER